jgi:hypothetical protein
MEDLQSLVAESLARSGFEAPETRSVQEPTASVETRLAASPEGTQGMGLEPGPLPGGF